MSEPRAEAGLSSCPSFEAGLQAVGAQVDNQLGDPAYNPDLLDTEIEAPRGVSFCFVGTEATELRMRQLRQELAGAAPAGIAQKPEAAGPAVVNKVHVCMEDLWNLERREPLHLGLA